MNLSLSYREWIPVLPSQVVLGPKDMREKLLVEEKLFIVRGRRAAQKSVSDSD
jgi:hypothetical protein